MIVLHLEKALSEGIVQPVLDQEHLAVRGIVDCAKLKLVQVLLYQL